VTGFSPSAAPLSGRCFLASTIWVRAWQEVGALFATPWRCKTASRSAKNTFPVRDPNQAKDITGRLGIVSEVSDKVSVQAGFSGLTGKGFHKGTPPTKRP